MKPVLVLLVVLVLAGCGGSSAPTTAPRAARTTPAAPTGRPTDAEIRRGQRVIPEGPIV
jgi:predicted small lipoprotein YifL